MKAKKLIALFIAAIMAISLFAIMAGCDSAEKNYVGAWYYEDEDMYVIIDEDGTCKEVSYFEDEVVFEEEGGSAYLCLEGTYEITDDGIVLTYDLLGKKDEEVEYKKYNFYGSKAAFEAVDEKDVPDYYTFEEYIDLGMDMVVDIYAEAGLELSDEDYDTLREELIGEVLG